MKPFTKYFLVITIGIILGYAWAYQSYMPKIRTYEAALATYQEHFSTNSTEASHDR